MTLPLSLTKRTMWREMPRGSAARIGSGHSSSGTSHGRSSSAGSGWAAVIWRFWLTTVLGSGGWRGPIVADDGASRPGPHAIGTVRARTRGAGRRTGPPRGRSVLCDSVGETLARAGVERVLLALADADPDGLALRGDPARVDSHDDLRLASTGGQARAGHLLRERTVDERVRAELFDDLDDNGERVLRAGGDDVEGLGTEAEGDLALVLGVDRRDDRTLEGHVRLAEVRRAVGNGERTDVHRGGADEAGDEHV